MATVMMEIKHRRSPVVLFSAEVDTIKRCVEAAVWARVDLAGADLAGADLTDADLAFADLVGAKLVGAKLADANLAFAKGDFASPEESDAMLARIAEIVLAHPERLAMHDWHGSGWDAAHTPEEEVQHACKTAHCMAGWAQALCPVPVIRRMDPERAGLMLIPTAAHMFRATDAEALEFLREKLGGR